MPTSAIDPTSETSAAGNARPTSALERWLEPNVLVFLACWLFVGFHFASNWNTIGVFFRDADDLMRLTQVRDFVAGQPWFDLHQYRLDPPADRPMHWSRLVDLPIALLMRAAGAFVAMPLAEKAAMFVWPLLTLVPALIGAQLLAGRLGGKWAFLPALYLFATLPQSIGQFVPGRIDHHNIQIALTLLLLATLAAPLSRARAVGVGIVSALMLAIGLETLPFLIIAALAYVGRFVFDAEARDEVAAWGLTLAGATLAAGLATLPVSEWGRGACDALSVSYVGLAAVGGLGIAGATRLRGLGVVGRAIAVGVVGAVALVVFAWPEPKCLAGPFGEILPVVKTIWLDKVAEVAPYTRFFAEHKAAGVLALVMPTLGLAAAAFLASQPQVRSRPGFWPAVAAAAITFVVGWLQLRTMIYANALATPLVAAAIGVLARESAAKGRSVVVAVLGGLIVANPVVAEVVVARLAPKAWIEQEKTASGIGEGSASDVDMASESGPPCYATARYGALGRLPAALVAAEIDIGPVILATTHHSVVAAPYHRMQRGIIDGETMMNGEPEEALRLMRARGVDYVVDCTAAKIPPAPGSVLEAIRAGRTPAGLVEIPGDPVVRVFRVERIATAFTEH